MVIMNQEAATAKVASPIRNVNANSGHTMTTKTAATVTMEEVRIAAHGCPLDDIF